MKQVAIDFRISGKELFLEYELLTERCSWSIFDIGGVEMCKGILLGNGPHTIPIECLKPNVYQLCIIDGDQLFNSRFRVS